jgi:transposase
VIAVPAGARILLASKPVDFRKGAHSLAALAAEVLDADPFSGTVLVFRSRRADRPLCQGSCPALRDDLSFQRGGTEG